MYMPLCPRLEEKQEYSFMRNIQMSVFGESLVCATSLHLCPALLLCPVLIWPWHIIHKRVNIGACFFPHLHLEHAGSDTFIVSRAPATLWPASQWLPLYYPPISPCIALSSDSTEHHHQAHFSPNSADNAGEPPRSYLSSVSAPHKEFFSRAM